MAQGSGADPMNLHGKNLACQNILQSVFDSFTRLNQGLRGNLLDWIELDQDWTKCLNKEAAYIEVGIVTYQVRALHTLIYIFVSDLRF